MLAFIWLFFCTILSIIVTFFLMIICSLCEGPRRREPSNYDRPWRATDGQDPFARTYPRPLPWEWDTKRTREPTDYREREWKPNDGVAKSEKEWLNTLIFLYVSIFLYFFNIIYYIFFNKLNFILLYYLSYYYFNLTVLKKLKFFIIEHFNYYLKFA